MNIDVSIVFTGFFRTEVTPSAYEYMGFTVKTWVEDDLIPGSSIRRKFTGGKISMLFTDSIDVGDCINEFLSAIESTLVSTGLDPDLCQLSVCCSEGDTTPAINFSKELLERLLLLASSMDIDLL